MPDPLTRDLPYEGTIHDFRTTAAADAERALAALTRLNRTRRELPDLYSPVEFAEQNAITATAAMYAAGLVAVLGWLSAEHPDLAYQSAAMVQDVAKRRQRVVRGCPAGGCAMTAAHECAEHGPMTRTDDLPTPEAPKGRRWRCLTPGCLSSYWEPIDGNAVPVDVIHALRWEQRQAAKQPAPSDPVEWSRHARAKHRHYLNVFQSAEAKELRRLEQQLSAMVPLPCDAIDALTKAPTEEPGTYKTVDLTDEALADINRWHAIVHPVMAEAGVFEPERNPSGCDRFFCLDIVTECAAVAAPRWFEAGVAEGRRAAANEMWAQSQRLRDADPGRQTRHPDAAGPKPPADTSWIKTEDR
jgi:hypothetical protein